MRSTNSTSDWGPPGGRGGWAGGGEGGGPPFGAGLGGWASNPETTPTANNKAPQTIRRSGMGILPSLVSVPRCTSRRLLRRTGRGRGLVNAAKDHPAGRRLQHAGHGDGHVLADVRPALLHHHHRAVLHVADALPILIALL